MMASLLDGYQGRMQIQCNPGKWGIKFTKLKYILALKFLKSETFCIHSLLVVEEVAKD